MYLDTEHSLERARKTLAALRFQHAQLTIELEEAKSHVSFLVAKGRIENDEIRIRQRREYKRYLDNKEKQEGQSND